MKNLNQIGIFLLLSLIFTACNSSKKEDHSQHENKKEDHSQHDKKETTISDALSMASAMSAYEFPNIPQRNLIVVRNILARIPTNAIFSPDFGV